MSNLCSIKNHVAFTEYKHIKKVCNYLLKHTPVTYFCYQRLYPNNRYTLLPTQPDYGEFLLSPQIYPYSWLIGTTYENIKSGYIFWDLAKPFLNIPVQEEIYKTITNDFGLNHGIDIIEKSGQHCDIYCFASNDTTIYKMDLFYLQRFIFYFKQECRFQLINAWENPIHLPIKSHVVSTPPIINFSNNKPQTDNVFEIKKYHLQNIDIYLTQKEILCLKFLANGYTAKEAARALNISNRTVEKHISNVKIKLNCSQLTEVIIIARENFIL